jgi:hypothetical protein
MSKLTLETLAAQLEINQVLRRYCRSMDRIDAPLGYSVWHEDGIADYGPVFKGTGRGFIDWVCDYHRSLESTSHQIANALIEVDGDKAVSETYVTVTLLAKENGQGRLTTGRGRYLDNWSLRGGRWAIDTRCFLLDFAFTQDVQAQIGWGIRNSSDPSYGLLGALGTASSAFQSIHSR